MKKFSIKFIPSVVAKGFAGLMCVQMIVPLTAYAGSSKSPAPNRSTASVNQGELEEFVLEDIAQINQSIAERRAELKELRESVQKSKLAGTAGATVSIAAGSLMLFLTVKQYASSRNLGGAAILGAIGAFSVASGSFSFKLNSSNKDALKELIDLTENRLNSMEQINSSVSSIMREGLKEEHKFLISKLLIERASNIESSAAVLEELEQRLKKSKIRDGVVQYGKWPVYLVGAAGLLIAVRSLTGPQDAVSGAIGWMSLGTAVLTLPGTAALAHFSAEDVSLLESRIQTVRNSMDEQSVYIKKLQAAL